MTTRAILAVLTALALSGCKTVSPQSPEVADAAPRGGEALRAAVSHRKFKVYREDGYAILRVYRDGNASWQNPTGWQFQAPWRVEGDLFCLDDPQQGGCWRLWETAEYRYRALRIGDDLALDWCDMKGIDQGSNLRCDEPGGF